MRKVGAFLFGYLGPKRSEFEHAGRSALALPIRLPAPVARILFAARRPGDVWSVMDRLRTHRATAGTTTYLTTERRLDEACGRRKATGSSGSH